MYENAIKMNYVDSNLPVNALKLLKYNINVAYNKIKKQDLNSHCCFGQTFVFESEFRHFAAN